MFAQLFLYEQPRYAIKINEIPSWGSPRKKQQQHFSLVNMHMQWCKSNCMFGFLLGLWAICVRAILFVFMAVWHISHCWCRFVSSFCENPLPFSSLIPISQIDVIVSKLVTAVANHLHTDFLRVLISKWHRSGSFLHTVIRTWWYSSMHSLYVGCVRVEWTMKCNRSAPSHGGTVHLFAWDNYLSPG